MTFSQLLRVLRARWHVICVAGACGLVVALLWALLARPVYLATAQVIVNVRAPETVGSQTAVDQLSPDYLATQMDVIRSDRVANLAARRLGRARGQAILSKQGGAANGADASQAVAQSLAADLSIDSVNSSRVITISYRASDPLLSADVANALARAYLDTSLDLQAEPARNSARWYERRSSALQQQLSRAQAKLTAQQSALGVTADVDKPDAEDARLQALSVQLANAQAGGAAAASQTAGAALPEMMTNPVVQNLQAEIAKAEAQRRLLSVSAGPNNPDYRQLVAQLAALRQQLTAQQALVRQSTAAAAAQAGSGTAQLAAAVAAQKQRVIASRARTDQVNVDRQDVRNLQAVYDQMAARRSQLDLLGESSQSNVAILSPAVAPAQAIWPRPRLMALAGVLLGAAIAAAALLASELVDQRVRSAEDFEIWLGIPSFGPLRIAPAGPPAIGGVGRLLLPFRRGRQDER